MKNSPRPLLKQLFAIRNQWTIIRRAIHSPELAPVPWAEIGNGKQKFMLVSVYVHGESGMGKDVVRGVSNAKHHAEIYKKIQKDIKKLELCTMPNGGGELNHDSEKKKIEILWAKSEEYGKADEYAAQEALQKHFPDYEVIIKKKPPPPKDEDSKDGKDGKKNDKKKDGKK